MSKNKLLKFSELNCMSNTIQPKDKELLNGNFRLKGKWNEEFQNHNPIILELGCGKGEYTIELARNNPTQNYIGIDIKGARIWKGAKISQEENLKNVRFLRTQIEFLETCFSNEEIAEIWITFPDPHIKFRRRKKRLVSPRMLKSYRNILNRAGLVHLKTDSKFLHGYTLGVLENINAKVIKSSHDLYKSKIENKVLNIKTFYESMFLKKNKPITYICFKLV